MVLNVGMDLVVMVDPAMGTTYVYGRKPSGVLVEFSDAGSAWQLDGLRNLDATIGDLVGYYDASGTSPRRLLYAELADNDFAAFDYDSQWELEHITNVDNLTTLGVASH